MERVVLKGEDPYYDRFFISQGIKVGNLVYTSGQVAIQDDGELVPGGFMEQGEKVFANLKRALEAGGSSLGNIIKVTIFVTDMQANFESIKILRRKYFTEPYPADTIVQIQSLYRPEALLEIEAVGLVH